MVKIVKLITMLKKITLYIFTFLTLFSATAHGQLEPVTAATALKLFKAEKYSEAKDAYQQLLQQNNRDLTSNYYYGISLYQLKENSDEALQRLKLASTRPPSNDVHFYLGQLYQRAYENELAIDHLQKFLKTAKESDPRKEKAERAIEDCKSASSLINKHFEIEVLKKDTVEFSVFLDSYKLSKDAGELMKASEFFKIGVNPENIIFKTERGSQVLFPIQGAKKDYDLYKIVRLLDSWTDAEVLSGNVNSTYNDLYPFLLIDGVTLYFASDRPGGMGGLDIYQSFLDAETGEFSEPSNLGPPFNSPDDDFLLVPDVYEGKAWFTTNRGVAEGKVVVAQIVWDNKVIRSLTENVNQIKTLSSLPLSKDASVKSSSTLFAGEDQPEERNQDEFKFIINDTIIYTKQKHFKNLEALSLYKKGRKEEIKKDSLQLLMAAKRKQYAKSYDQQELQRLINEIVTLEKQTYGLDELIQNYFLYSRKKEIETLQQLISQGIYQNSETQKKAATEKNSTQAILENLKKNKFTFYSDDSFLKRKEKVEPMYKNFFNKQQINELLRSDSLYVWANILALESAKILEQAHAPNPENVSLKRRVLNSADVEEEENQRIQTLIAQSREYKMNSLDLYEHALDQKFAIYYPLAMEYGSTSNHIGNQNMLNQAKTIFRESNDNIRSVNGYDPEKTEHFLALKRMSIDMLENSFNHQMTGASSDTQKSSTATGVRFIDTQQPINIQPANKNIQSTIKKEKPEQQNQTTGATKPVFKVQIGIFQNEPNKNALAKLTNVTHEIIPGKNLKKYFAGNWNNYEEAQAQVASIRQAGFPGAFVVAFLNNVPIPLNQARNMK